jgi:hypothetical protein
LIGRLLLLMFCSLVSIMAGSSHYGLCCDRDSVWHVSLSFLISISGMQVAKRLERTAAYFRRLGNLGFWGQLICSVVSAVILAFSIVVTGQATSPVSTYLTAGGIAAAFLSVFWSFGYIRLSHRLRETIDDPIKVYVVWSQMKPVCLLMKLCPRNCSCWKYIADRWCGVTESLCVML